MAIKNLQPLRHHLLLCNGGTCKQRGAESVTTHIRAELTAAGLDDTVHTTKTLCNGRCSEGPIVAVMPDNIWYGAMDEMLGSRLVTEHLAPGGAPLRELVLFDWQQPTAERPDLQHRLPAPVRPPVPEAAAPVTTSAEPAESLKIEAAPVVR